MQDTTPANDLIFDVGMNVCEDTDFYLRKGFRVVAVEANPARCREAAERYPGEIAEGRLVVLNKAIAPEAGSLTFYVCAEMSAWSTTVPELRDSWAAQGARFEAIEVEAITVADLLAAYGVPYYAKIDIEGQDMTVLRALAELEVRPEHLSFEVDFKSAREAITLCERLGYESLTLVDQAAVAGQSSPIPALEGRDADYRFRRGCSGPFGRELPAGWGSGAEVRSACDRIVRQARLAKLLTRGLGLVGRAELAERLKTARFPRTQTWYDIHASRLAHGADGRLRPAA